MPIRIVADAEKRKAKRGQTKGPKGIGRPSIDWRSRLKDVGKRFPRPKENLIEKLGGSEKAKPHSTKEGRVASGERRIRRMLKPKHVKPTPRPQYTPKPSPGRPSWPKRKRMQPLRAKHGIGSLVKGAKKIIGKVIKPKPKVDDIDKPFKGYDKSYTRADDKKMDAILKKLGDEIKAQPLPPKLKETMKKLQKAYGPHKKAEGGRIGLKKGSVHKPGTHSWYLQQMSRPKKASGGRIGLQHGSRPKPTGPHTWVRKKPKGVKIAIKGW